MLKQYK